MAGFFYYDLTFLILFTLGVIIFLYKRRSNLKREGIMYLYRTQVGIKFINYVGGKYKKTLKVLGYFIIAAGYILMVLMLYLLGQIAYIYLKSPDIVRAIKVPPLIPLIPYLPSIFKIDFLPPFYFTYWIIAIAVIAVFHEFSHGIYAKLYNIKIKTTGFGFLGPFLAAFVEPDEKQMLKKSKLKQITILSAGTFTNLVLAILFFLLLSLFFVLTYAPAGAMFNTYSPGIVSVSNISMLDGKRVVNPSNEALLAIINENNLTDDLILGIDENQINLTKITANNKSYFITVDNLKEQLAVGGAQVALYEDLPAINAGLKGIIIEIDGNKIKTHDDLAIILDNYKVGDKVNIKTKDNNTILNYNLTLGEDSQNKSRAVIGIGVLNQNTRLIGRVYQFFNFFEKPGTYYEPRFNTDLVIFIYYLIWWLALVNISVALMNMLPVALFDGGRMFMLTIAGITGSEKAGQWAFKVMTYVILGIFLLLMVGWFLAIF
ncbi:MAG: site-2 protease family protein [Candidatus Nanoarchaeia archaeon]|nr:site-2 protease family protein [Candidatus Nanoarchaeia archaeon]MDD5740862.1 site-2 protease family protein [Candidatus Nanoarchaeia archaeon]